jgi:hypothetical protein
MTVRFDVEKSTEREPNRAKVELCNLTPDVREQLEQAAEPQIELEAGYKDLIDVIFAGDVRSVHSRRSGPDIWTVIDSEDGGRAYRTARISRGWDAGVSLSTVIAACADAMGVGRGNSASVAAAAELESGGAVFPDGITLDSPARQALDRVCRSAGLRASVQNGVILLQRGRHATGETAIVLSSGSGLVGSPTRGSQDARSGVPVYSARALLNPGLYPGRSIRLETDTVTGDYTCSRVRYRGETTGSQWHAEIELEEVDS